jgi:hypothetical protein
MIFVFPPAALVCGLVARSQMKQSGESGAGMALAAVIVGGIFTGLMVLAIALPVMLIAGNG